MCLSACSAAVEEPVFETATSTVTPTASATVIWFPATSTSTSIPTRQPEPTENFHPGVGDVLLKDDFSKIVMWSTKTESGGNISLNKNELTLALQVEKAYVASIYSSEDLASVSVEVTSNVTLCKAEDSYGMLVRASNADRKSVV
jgi:hypothetical protein